MTKEEKVKALKSEIAYAKWNASWHEKQVYVASATCDEATVKYQTERMEEYLGKQYRAQVALAELTGEITCEDIQEQAYL